MGGAIGVGRWVGCSFCSAIFCSLRVHSASVCCALFSSLVFSPISLCCLFFPSPLFSFRLFPLLYDDFILHHFSLNRPMVAAPYDDTPSCARLLSFRHTVCKLGSDDTPCTRFDSPTTVIPVADKSRDVSAHPRFPSTDLPIAATPTSPILLPGRPRCFRLELPRGR